MTCIAHLGGIAAADDQLYGRQSTCEYPDSGKTCSTTGSTLEWSCDDQVSVNGYHGARTDTGCHWQHL